MRRLVLVFLLLLMPVQWTWAAAAAYCGHESRSAGGHVGHHQHDHVGGQKAGKSGQAADSGQVQADVDGDCDYCHLGASHWLLAAFSPAPPPALTNWPTVQPRIDTDFLSSGPERPDRRLAV